MEHLSIQAREEVEQEMKPEIEKLQQAAGGKIPDEEQVRVQELMESKIAERIAEMTEEMVTEEQEMMQQQEEDPLIALKQQEINLRADDIERKKQYDEGRLGLDAEKLQQTEDLTEAKIDSQEDIAQLRANVNLAKQAEIEKSKKSPRKVDVKKDIRFEN